jgi:hypothetical protein
VHELGDFVLQRDGTEASVPIEETAIRAIEQ